MLGVQIPDMVFSAAALPIEVLLKLSHAFARLPGASVYLPTPSPFELILLFGLGFGLLLVRRQAGRVLAIAALLTLAIDLGVTWIGRPLDGRMTAVFLDVGQGDAAWVELPDGKTLLIDTGGGFDQNFDVGRNVIARFLWDRRHASVDIVALSHPHPDHVDGARFILEHFHVGELWTGPEFPGPDGYGADLLDAARRNGVVHRVLKAGDVALHGSETTIRVLAPPEHLWDDVNDNSLVLRIDFGDTAFLFPGDIGARAERRVWLSDYPLRADVLKVPHHGSITSTSREFLASVSPRYAVISAGLHNRYGLPDEDVISRLEDSGAAVFRTDESGTIEIMSDGRAILSAGPAIER